MLHSLPLCWRKICGCSLLTTTKILKRKRHKRKERSRAKDDSYNISPSHKRKRSAKIDLYTAEVSSAAHHEARRKKVIIWSHNRCLLIKIIGFALLCFALLCFSLPLVLRFVAQRVDSESLF